MFVHLVLYSNNEPFNTTKQLLVDSIKQNTRHEVVIHEYNLEIIKQKDWFKNIQDLPRIYKYGRRDGYYNSWKPFIIKEVYDSIDNDDIIYYVDCSQHFRSGFTESIDTLVQTAFELGFIAGSVGKNRDNSTCCEKLEIWDKIIPNVDNSQFMSSMHVLNSWFIFRKGSTNIEEFINEWVYFTCYKDDKLKRPLVVYHHPGDQSIYNILVYKYNFPVFFSDDIYHDVNKDRNVVLRILNNNTSNINQYLIKLR